MNSYQFTSPLTSYMYDVISNENCHDNFIRDSENSLNKNFYLFIQYAVSILTAESNEKASQTIPIFSTKIRYFVRRTRCLESSY